MDRGRDPFLDAVLSLPVQCIAVNDHSWPADAVAAVWERLSWWTWTEENQAALDACWDAGADALATLLAGEYGAHWPDVFKRLAEQRAPAFCAAVRTAVAAGRIRCRQRFLDADGPFETAVWLGAYIHVARDRGPRAWPAAQRLLCPVCGDAFWAGNVSGTWMLRQYGPPHYCPSCCCRAKFGGTVDTAEGVIEGLRRLAAATGAIPTAGFPVRVSIAGLPRRRRDEVMRALVTTPTREQVARHLPGTWLQSLQAAGLVGDAWRPARGTYSTAADGHACRSLAERSIDDWLAAAGIAHTPEPPYPGSRRRADWLLDDGTFVEYAGLLDDEGYRAKMRDKAEAAALAGIRLLVLQPEDLADLPGAFAAWLPLP